MKVIYIPKGKALEYGEYACNLYRGCGHRCVYCYAPSVLRIDKREFFNNPQPRNGIIEALRKDAKKLREFLTEQYTERCNDWLNGEAASCPEKPEIPFVFLCFTCDPYQPINKEHNLTRQAIEILHGEGLGVNILTKGMITDFDLLVKKPHLSKVGITLTGGDDNIWEPGSTPEILRLWNLEEAKKANIKTWVSMEPVIDTEVCIDVLIHSVRNITDEFKIGKWNYSPEAKKIDWYKFGHNAEAICKKLGVNYYIKDDLRREMENSNGVK